MPAHFSLERDLVSHLSDSKAQRLAIDSAYKSIKPPLAAVSKLSSSVIGRTFVSYWKAQCNFASHDKDNNPRKASAEETYQETF